MRFPFLTAGFALVAALAAGGAYTLFSFHQFRDSPSRFPGNCSPVAGVAGPEDIQVAPRLGRAFISSTDRRSAAGARGAILSVSLEDPLDSNGWRDRTAGAPKAFRPLGLNYYEEGDERRLFVVNEATNAIEIFKVAGNGDLEHLETFEERRLTSPNDIVAVGLRSFYVSNDVDHGRRSLLGKFEFLTRAQTGKIFFFDGVAMRLAADGLRFANGVAINQTGDRFYAAETSGEAIMVYDRNPETNALTPSRREKMSAAVDNINIAWDGALWIGAHPKPLELARLERDITAKAPSLVIRFVDEPNVASPMSEIFSDDGRALSASSVAAVAGDKLLIGALVEDKYLICDLPG